MKAAIAAEHIVHHEKDQIRVENDQSNAAQGFGVDEVEIGRHDEITHKLAVLLHLEGADRYLDIAAHIVEQANAQESREALVDDFHGGHARAHDTFLRRQVVRANATCVATSVVGFCFFGILGNATQERVDFILGKKIR